MIETDLSKRKSRTSNIVGCVIISILLFILSGWLIYTGINEMDKHSYEGKVQLSTDTAMTLVDEYQNDGYFQVFPQSDDTVVMFVDIHTNNSSSELQVISKEDNLFGIYSIILGVVAAIFGGVVLPFLLIRQYKKDDLKKEQWGALLELLKDNTSL